ncbi:hypothetical protein [Chitinibacter tainanensis]|uniref:hypothetical protein n=1 Tax=Chitinibacter tainanensis TaxID=230667 RepID=UPI00041B5161|nr:hypothetical protein [Chitinibacter tainanensis]
MDYQFDWQIEEEIEVTEALPDPISRWSSAPPPSDRESMAYAQLYKVMSDMQVALRQREEMMQQMHAGQIDVLLRWATLAEELQPFEQRRGYRIGVLAGLLAHFAGLDRKSCEQLCRAAMLAAILRTGDGAVQQAVPFLLAASSVPEVQMSELIVLQMALLAQGIQHTAEGEPVHEAAQMTALVLQLDDLLTQGQGPAQLQPVAAVFSGHSPRLVQYVAEHLTQLIHARELCLASQCPERCIPDPAHLWLQLVGL